MFYSVATLSALFVMACAQETQESPPAPLTLEELDKTMPVVRLRSEMDPLMCLVVKEGLTPSLEGLAGKVLGNGRLGEVQLEKCTDAGKRAEWKIGGEDSDTVVMSLMETGDVKSRMCLSAIIHAPDPAIIFVTECGSEKFEHNWLYTPEKNIVLPNPWLCVSSESELGPRQDRLGLALTRSAGETGTTRSVGLALCVPFHDGDGKQTVNLVWNPHSLEGTQPEDEKDEKD